MEQLLASVRAQLADSDREKLELHNKVTELEKGHTELQHSLKDSEGRLSDLGNESLRLKGEVAGLAKSQDELQKALDEAKLKALHDSGDRDDLLQQVNQLQASNVKAAHEVRGFHLILTAL